MATTAWPFGFKAEVDLDSEEAAVIVRQSLEVDVDPRPEESNIVWQNRGTTLLLEVGALDPRLLRRTVNSAFEMLLLSVRTLNAFAPTN